MLKQTFKNVKEKIAALWRVLILAKYETGKVYKPSNERKQSVSMSLNNNVTAVMFYR